jgi:hypothetical protein
LIFLRLPLTREGERQFFLRFVLFDMAQQIQQVVILQRQQFLAIS